MRARLLLVLILAAASASASSGAQSMRFSADPQSAKWGVGEYQVERMGNEVRVDVLDASPREARIAALNIELETPEGIEVTIERSEHRLRLTWSNRAARLTLTDMDTGESGSRTIELGRSRNIVQEGSAQLFERYEREVALGGLVLDETLTNLELRERYGARRGISLQSSGGREAAAPPPVTQASAGRVAPQNQYPPYSGDGTCSPVCNGPIIDAGSYSVATSRSLCCNDATQATNNACSNRYCWGCCRILGCDAACAGTSDYFCGCSVEGQACSAGDAC